MCPVPAAPLRGPEPGSGNGYDLDIRDTILFFFPCGRQYGAGATTANVHPPQTVGTARGAIAFSWSTGYSRPAGYPAGLGLLVIID